MEKPWKYSVEIPLTSERYSKIVYNTLKVDSEPRPKEITREISTKGESLLCNWSSATPQLLRVSIGSFFANLSLILDTIDNFDISE